MLIENDCNDFDYGRKYYDYSDATLLFFPPEQSIQMDEKKPLPHSGWLLVFHPHLLCGTDLDTNIGQYTFFSYNPQEALHLSVREKMKAVECLTNIAQELQHAIDRHSQIIISKYIELFFDYCSRFYERQFITRNEVNKEVLSKLNIVLDEYIHSGKLRSKIFFSIEDCAKILHLSPHYFIDLLHVETGQTLEGYFQLKRMETAKMLLMDKDNQVGEVVQWLGYPSVPYFNRLFLKVTGMTPEEYRLRCNYTEIKSTQK